MNYIYDMNIATMDLNLLKAFDAMIRERSVTAAARRIGLSQPAMSHALGRLRQVFEDDLFIRSASGMTPTLRAQALAPEIAAALDHVQRALSRPAPFDPAATTRTFSVAATEYVEAALAAPLAKVFANNAPSADLRLLAATKTSFLKQLEAGEVDLAAGHFTDITAHCTTQLLYREKLVLVARKQHPALLRGKVSLDLYLSLTHALVSPTGEKTGAIDKELRARALKRRVGLVLASYLALPLALAHSDFVATIPAQTAAWLALISPLSIYDLPFEHVMDATIVWHRRDEADPGHQWFRNAILRAKNAPT